MENITKSPSNSSKTSGNSMQSVAVLLGNTMEYFDNFVYVHMLVIISPLFFPEVDPFALSIFAVTSFAINYIARPFGALFFGYLGDRVGRRTSLYLSLALMFLATGAMGILPTYSQIGIYASAALLVFRFLQGLSCSGESSGALIYVMESVPPAKRFFYSAMYNATITGGGVIAALVISLSLSLLGEETSWRYPFIIAAMVGALGLVFRYNLNETREFKAHQRESDDFKIRYALLNRLNAIRISRVASFAAFDAATFWVTYIAFTLYLKDNVGLTSVQVVMHNGGVMICEIAAGFVAARLVLNSSPRLFALRTVGVMIASIFPLLLLIRYTGFSYAAVLFAQLFVITCGNFFCVSTDPCRARMFPVIGRFLSMALGVSFGKMLSYVLGAYMLIWLQQLFGEFSVGVYLMLFGTPVILALVTMPEEKEGFLVFPVREVPLRAAA